MRIIGITGPSGSGKSVLKEYFSSLSLSSFFLDCDALYHSMIDSPSPCADAIVAAFGDTVKNSNGGINRKALSAIVFSDKEKLSLLNSAVFHYVALEVKDIIEAKEKEGAELFILDAPTLYQSGIDSLCNLKVAVLADRSVRKDRIVSRDLITHEMADARLDSQPDDEYYISRSDFVLENNGSKAELFLSLSRYLKEIAYI